MALKKMQLANKTIVVIGLGKTGVAVSRFLRNRGAIVVATDKAAESELGTPVAELRKLGIRLELGRHDANTFTKADLIVISPGVPHTLAGVTQAQARGIPVIGEIELASAFIQEPIVAVTGTNGKTTTTELLGQMLANSDLKVFVGGNIGTPLIAYVDRAEKADVLVAEISSFQLDTVTTFRPKVGVLLNITEDHMDRYPNFKAYADAKIRIFSNQGTDDIAVLNGADALIRTYMSEIHSRKLLFNLHAKDHAGASIVGDRIVFHMADLWKSDPKFRIPRTLSLANFRPKGRHNLENACAAGLAAIAAGGRPQGIQAALDQFHGLAHRLEWVATIDGIAYFNDSKATNVDAVLRALECFRQPVVLIMGGLDKGSNFGALREAIQPFTKRLIVMGAAADRIKSALGNVSLTVSAASMADAVHQARQAAVPGDVVLLSPGCASFDMYANYTQRGEDFKATVVNLNRRNST
jgi:UDP-N-acetylmuramoylalanine--D-glutamate ligase